MDDDSSENSTPSQPIINMTEAAKKRVDNITTTKRCLIENTSESNHVDYAHCLGRSTKPLLLEKLEFAWKMERFTLNVDTRYNIFRLSAKFHRAFDANEWLLLPETRIIEAYYSALQTHQLPDVDSSSKVYQYTLIPHKTMLEIPIHRQMFPPPDPSMPPSAEDFTYYPYPYRDFPPIASHVHPRFVICSSGSKLQASLDLLSWQTGTETRMNDLVKVLGIWYSWRRAIPTEEFLKNEYEDSEPDINDNDSQRTSPHRVRRSTRPKRKAATNQESPTPNSCKHQKLQGRGVWLDDETLHEFDRQTSSREDLVAPKKQWILNWLSGLSDSRCTVDVKRELEGGGESDESMASGFPSPTINSF